MFRISKENQWKRLIRPCDSKNQRERLIGHILCSSLMPFPLLVLVFRSKFGSQLDPVSRFFCPLRRVDGTECFHRSGHCVADFAPGCLCFFSVAPSWPNNEPETAHATSRPVSANLNTPCVHTHAHRSASESYRMEPVSANGTPTFLESRKQSDPFSLSNVTLSGHFIASVLDPPSSAIGSPIRVCYDHIDPST